MERASAWRSSFPGPRPTSTRPRRRWRRSSTIAASGNGSPARSASRSTARTRPPGASTSARTGATSRARRCSRPRSRSRFPGGTVLTFHLAQNHGGWNSDDNQNHNLGRFRLVGHDARRRRRRPACPPACARSWRFPEARRTAEQTAAVFSYWRTTVPEWRGANAWIESLARQHPEGSSQLVLHERDKRRPTHHVATRRFPQAGRGGRAGRTRVLEPAAGRRRATRLSFARWLVDRNAPTTARSLVNRVWQAYFGTGIVATSEDLGTQCEHPSHPELLDWLAVEFMEHGWSLKHLHRLIATSATYRQSVALDARAAGPRSVQPPAGAGTAVPRRRRGRPRHRACRPAGCSTPRSAGRACARRRRRSCFSRRRATAPRSGSRPPAATGTAEPSIRSDIARCRIRCSRLSMPPTATSPASAAAARTRRYRRSRRSTSRSAWNARGRSALLSLREGGNTDADRLDLCLPPLPGAHAGRSRDCNPARTAAHGRLGDSKAPGPTRGPWRPNDPPAAARIARRRDAAPARGLDGGVARPLEPG